MQGCIDCKHYKPGWEGRPTAPVCITCERSWADPRFITGLEDKKDTSMKNLKQREAFKEVHTALNALR